MSVRYDYDPGRLDLYRPRADGLMGRCACGSALIHLLVGCILFTVQFPEPEPPKRRPYRITEVRLLPREKPEPAPEVEEPKKVAELLRPKDLSLFLNDLAPPRETRRRSRRRRRARPQPVRSVRVTPPQPSETKPEAPELKTARVDRPGPMLPVGLPGFLERPMADVTPVDVTPSGGASSPRPEPKREQPPKRVPAPEMPRETPTPPESRPAAESPTLTQGGGDRQEPAPKPVEVARAERPRLVTEPLPRPREESPGVKAGAGSGGAPGRSAFGPGRVRQASGGTAR
jgi:hypothetical protein